VSFVAEQFGANLRYCRRRAKLSQEELSFRAGLHRVTVGLLERGERIPRIDTLVKLASTLGVSNDELLDGLEWMPGAMTSGSFHFDGEGEP
jgi:transcriptional regulator with XRE-family HTH domain